MGKGGATPLPGTLTEEAIKKMEPSEALVALLTSAQADHKACVSKALNAQQDPVDQCALTWGNVLHRYQQFGAYRAPFADDAQTAAYAKYWTKKRADAYDQTHSA